MYVGSFAFKTHQFCHLSKLCAVGLIYTSRIVKDIDTNIHKYVCVLNNYFNSEVIFNSYCNNFMKYFGLKNTTALLPY